jgi:glyoxylate reductase
MKPKVLVTRLLPEQAMQMVTKALDAAVNPHDRPMSRQKLLQGLKGKAGVLSLLNDRMDAEAMDRAGSQLKVIANYAVGFDNIQVAEATRRGIVVTNTPEVLTETTADMTWALIMAVARRIVEGDKFLRKKKPWAWAPLMFLGRDVHGKTLGILGLGRIGQAVARRAKGFNMRLIYYNAIRQKPALEKLLGVEFKPLKTLLREADFVTCHTPLRPETRHLIDQRALRMMKKSAYLINTSRGPVVDEWALAEALKKGEIAGAGIDVFENEPRVEPKLLKLENVVVCPHIASATVETRTAMGTLAAKNLINVLSGKPPVAPVNPEVFKMSRPKP